MIPIGREAKHYICPKPSSQPVCLPTRLWGSAERTLHT